MAAIWFVISYPAFAQCELEARQLQVAERTQQRLQAAHDQAKVILESIQSLVEANGIPAETLLTYQAALEVAEADLLAGTEAVSLAEVALDGCQAATVEPPSNVTPEIHLSRLHIALEAGTDEPNRSRGESRADTSIVLATEGVVGFTYLLQTSFDLVSWEDQQSITPGTGSTQLRWALPLTTTVVTGGGRRDGVRGDVEEREPDSTEWIDAAPYMRLRVTTSEPSQQRPDRTRG